MKRARAKVERRPAGSRRDPQAAAAFLSRAAGLAAAGQLADAARAYSQAEAADPLDFRAPISLASIDMQLGRPAEALPRLRRAAELNPGLFEAHHNRGAVAQVLQLWGEAAEAYAAALRLRSDAVESRRNLAIVLAILGRVDEALAHHRQLAGKPETRAWALTRIALLRPAGATDAELVALRGLADDPAVADAVRLEVQFALGEVLERRGDDAGAFAAFEAGNRLKRQALAAEGVDTGALVRTHAEAARAVAAHYTPALIAQRRGAELATSAPIFVVGMPRSGSTLIEQILASHPEVAALGETAVLPKLLERGFPADKAEIRRLARRYLEQMRAAGWKGVGRFVDKTLENYLHVGAIALMFPNAVILHAVREAADTCLSCYRQLFATGAETLYDLAEIGAEYVTYRRLMEHWRTVLPGRVIDVDHEALVADPDRRIRWLVTEACGLPWNDACLAFHEAAGPVRTASSSQVRQPIFATSIQRWRRHEARLGPLLEALGPYAPALRS